MKLTNVNELPVPLIRALTGDRTDFIINWPNVSLTVLNMPPQQAVLMSRHYDEIEEDVSDRVWLLFGEALHWVLSQKKDSRYMVEVPLMLELDSGVTVWMRTDVIEQGCISDYKITSVWSSVFRTERDVLDLACQLNPYRLAAVKLWGFTIDRLQAVFLYRDWQKSKRTDKGYPSIPFETVNVPVLQEGDVIRDLETRAANLKKCLDEPGPENLIECSEHERWAKPTQYAVKKKGAKKAAKLFDNETAALEWMTDQELKTDIKMELKIRHGKSVRCEDYCAVKPFCAQYKRMKGE